MLESILVVKEALPYILQGALVTVGIVLGAMGIGLVLGIPVAVVQVYSPRAFGLLASAYVWFFRGIPVLVLLFLFYFGLFSLIGLNISAFAAAIIVLGLRGGAYQSQIFRGAILSLPQGQMKAARALGMSDVQAIQSIILPQALRLSIPGWSNEYSIVLKDSAIAFVLGTSEIMSRTHFVASRTYEHLPLYLAAGAVFFILTTIGLRSLRALEKRVTLPGYSAHS
ncbi:MAG: amino acid ABC transporter permease [Desulfovermiculus sp.]|nr:amino acid ABC transporter permease [Desulfovermiculus sp.]